MGDLMSRPEIAAKPAEQAIGEGEALQNPPEEDHAVTRRRWLAEPRVLWFALLGGLLSLAFGGTLVSLAGHALDNDLHSHILLIPLVTAYLIRCKRHELGRDFGSSPAASATFLVGGLVLLGLVPALGSEVLSTNDSLALRIAAWLCLLAACGLALLGWRWIRGIGFEVFFLGFMIPLPDAVVVALEGGLMAASADVSQGLFRLTGTPVFRDGQLLQVPGMLLEVAPECSGIRSTWVLLITSLLASYLFLRSGWRRVLLVGVVVPLGILRNALRIVVIGLLCVHVGPEMIHSWIHNRGGPVFFAVSLVPLLFLAWYLRRGDLRSGSSKNESDVLINNGQSEDVEQGAKDP